MVVSPNGVGKTKHGLLPYQHLEYWLTGEQTLTEHAVLIIDMQQRNEFWVKMRETFIFTVLSWMLRPSFFSSFLLDVPLPNCWSKLCGIPIRVHPRKTPVKNSQDGTTGIDSHDSSFTNGYVLK